MNALEQFTPLMDAVISHIHEGVILTDYKGKILFHNPAADELLGFPDFDSVSGIQKSTGIDLQQSLTMPANTSLVAGRIAFRPAAIRTAYYPQRQDPLPRSQCNHRTRARRTRPHTPDGNG